MKTILSVEPLDENMLKVCKYDAFICALGYETRARAIAESKRIRAQKRIAFGFTENRILDYSKNREWFESAGFEIAEPADQEAEMAFRSRLQNIGDIYRSNFSLCVDISSLSRLRIAFIVGVLTELSRFSRYRVDFVYSGAEFSVPSDDIGLNVSSGPVTDQFAGWSDDPDKPPAAIIGLGYERDKAVGAVEYIEPVEIWVFVPSDHEQEYSDAIREANRPLLEILGPGRLWPYAVYEPYNCFKSLESLVYGAVRTHRPVMLPFGPKLFMLCCLLVSLVHTQVAVWRFSSGDYETPVNRVPNGRIACLRALFSPRIDQVGET
jgi:hypothetical protein